ncbi:beta-glucan synthesis-associated [Basidiobolus meristosporus CBS 931.73]|uniref:Beta-glucan synthesis-associated n=1 Tax=Basidiobolus meristosporus CBS 931.73 TaxID=1314790 RepID=A0A1Y1XS67_9FUNG|nr:beta-glucan synthesis-associated [Basidiobolus meristosporus CBS 931.73]|eukprot:ORX88525.1 beta-glucan synthesis-associated [Basidiobolus meristosporus CBS 931.73]
MGLLQNRFVKITAITIVVVGLLCLIIITPIVQHDKHHRHDGKDYKENASIELKNHATKESTASAVVSSASTTSGSASSTVSSSSSASASSSSSTLSSSSSTSSTRTTTSSSASPTPTYAKWIDEDTPQEFRTKSIGGQNFTLVFSDEFNTPGRQFAEGKDPKWTAVDLWYWPTDDLEWYNPEAVTTSDGSMKIRITKEQINGKDYKSGMVQSWNKFCFTGGILEVNVSLPGKGNVFGFWPGIWTMGNLGRAGYGATTDGTWPYTYDTCDSAVGPDQDLPYKLSKLPGQKLNKCVCPGQDHPNPGTGRGAPEIDIFEAAGAYKRSGLGTVSMSDQIAPFNHDMKVNEKFVTLYSPDAHKNSYIGDPLQQCVSAINTVPLDAYEGKAFQTYSFEYVPGPTGYIIWRINDQPIWRLDAAAIGPDPISKVAQRLISAEPMSIIMNLGFSHSWGWLDFSLIEFPSTMWIDYVRVYQLPDKINVSCDPPDYPTAKYIQQHPNAYNNPTPRTWKEAGYEFPAYNVNGVCPGTNKTL